MLAYLWFMTLCSLPFYCYFFKKNAYLTCTIKKVMLIFVTYCASVYAYTLSLCVSRFEQVNQNNLLLSKKQDDPQFLCPDFIPKNSAHFLPF